MGWMIEDNWNGPLSYAEEKRRVVAHYTGELSNGVTFRPVHISNARPAWYVAVEVTIPAGVKHDAAPYAVETLADGSRRYVFAEVMLTRNSAREWGYKCICEASGPVQAKAPLALLKKLSEIQGDDNRSEWARKWRKNCRAYHDTQRQIRALKPGDRIKLHYAATFGQSDPVDTFDVIDPTAYGYAPMSAPAFKTPSGAICRLRPDTLAAGFDVLA